MFYIARLNFIYSDHTALTPRSIKPPTKPASYTSVLQPFLSIQSDIRQLGIIIRPLVKSSIACANCLTWKCSHKHQNRHSF